MPASMAEAYCWRICTRSGRGDCGVVDRGRGARATMRERTACARPEIDYHTRDHDRGGPLAHSPESPRHQTTTAEPDPPGAAGRQPAGPSRRRRRRRRRAPTLLHQPPSLAPPHAAYGAALSLASSSSSSASHASSPEDTRPQCCSAANTPRAQEGTVDTVRVGASEHVVAVAQAYIPVVVAPPPDHRRHPGPHPDPSQHADL
eukprot:SAG25_NODE_2480_length_1578_cov_1.149899_2_plen_203_part_00